MALIVAGAVFLVLGAVAFFVWRSQQKSLNAMVLTETLTCAELGVAAPWDQGVLTAPESGREVVWHRSEAIEHYWDTERDMSKVEIGSGLLANIAEAFLQKTRRSASSARSGASPRASGSTCWPRRATATAGSR